MPAKAWQRMRLLLDECVPARFSKALPSHQVSTVGLEAWSGVKNGKFLALAAAKFDALITVDTNLPYQQSTSNLPLAVVVLDVMSIELPYLLPLVPALVPALEAALENLKPGSCMLLRSDA